MSDFAHLLNHNERFSETFAGNLPAVPRIPTLILTCMDARVDPAHFLGLELGDAPVLRTGGARVTRDVEIQIAVLFMLVKQNMAEAFEGITMAIIHHTNCGYERLATPEFRALLGEYCVAEDEMKLLGITDHAQAIRADIDRLRRSPHVPKEISITGYMYDVESGHMTEVVPETSLDATPE